MKRILIADDSVFMRAIMRKFLEKNGYVVVGEAEDGRVAFKKYKELAPDIVTMDITMNDMNGLESLQEIIKYDKDARVIMVSAMGQDVFIKQALDLGAKGFLVKPLNESAVVAEVARNCV